MRNSVLIIFLIIYIFISEFVVQTYFAAYYLPLTLALDLLLAFSLHYFSLPGNLRNLAVQQRPFHFMVLRTFAFLAVMTVIFYLI
jgi:hypothetical protein